MKCKYCGMPAGLFSGEHKECREKYNSAAKLIAESLSDYINSEKGLYEPFGRASERTMSEGYIKQEEFENIVIATINRLLQGKFRPWRHIIAFINSTSERIKDTVRQKSVNTAYAAFWKDIVSETMDTYFAGPCGLYKDIKTELLDGLNETDIEEFLFDAFVSDCLKEKLKESYRPFGFMMAFVESLPQQTKDSLCETPYYADYMRKLLEEGFSSSNLIPISNSCTSVITQEQKDILMYARAAQSDTIQKVTDRCVLTYIEHAIEKALSDGLIEPEEEDYIHRLTEEFGLSGTSVLYNSQCYQRLVKALVLRDILEGKPVERVNFNNIPILLGKTEKMVWAFTQVYAYEEKTKRTYVGKSRGVNVKICKGVYYRVGASKGYPVDQQYQSPLGAGVLCITTKNLTFVGNKSVKIPINKVISYTEYSDGIEIIKDGANPKPYTFVGCDTWFLINAIQLLS